MAAPKNNQFWKQRSKHGKDKLFKTPQLLLEAANEYFEWCDKNPLKSQKSFGTGFTTHENVMRAYTLTGLCIYLGCNLVYFHQFKQALAEKNDRISKDYSNIVTYIEQVIYTQKFEGAAAGLLNSNIIARDLSLVDKKDVSSESDITIRVIIE